MLATAPGATEVEVTADDAAVRRLRRRLILALVFRSGLAHPQGEPT
jgi:hypothetical protein